MFETGVFEQRLPHRFGLAGGAFGRRRFPVDATATVTVDEPVVDLYPTFDAAFDFAGGFYKIAATIATTTANFLAMSGVSATADPTSDIGASGYLPADAHLLTVALGARDTWSVYIEAAPATHVADTYHTLLALFKGSEVESQVRINRDPYTSSPYQLRTGIRDVYTTVGTDTNIGAQPGSGTFKLGITVSPTAVKFFKGGSLVRTETTTIGATKLFSALAIGDSSIAGQAAWNGRVKSVLIRLGTDSDAVAAAMTGPSLSSIFSRPGQTFGLGAYPQDDAASWSGWMGWSDMASAHVDHQGCDIAWAVTSIAGKGASGGVRHWSVPQLTENPVSGQPTPTLALAAGGAYDSYYTQMAQAILPQAPASGVVLIRTGWEFNGDWFAWKAQTAPAMAQFVTAFRRLVDRFRAVSPRFRFIWCPNQPGPSSADIELAYPGDAYVDVIGYDLYAESGNAGWWGYVKGDARGLDWLVGFAAAHGKPIGIDEFGTAGNGAGDVTQTRQMAEWILGHALYGIYWDSDLNYAGKLSDGVDAARGAEFKAVFQPVATSLSLHLNGNGVASLEADLAASGPVASWSLGANPDGFALSGSTLHLGPQTWVSGGDNTREVPVTLLDRAGHTSTATVTVTVDGGEVFDPETVGAPTVLITADSLTTNKGSATMSFVANGTWS